VLQAIDKAITSPILFILSFENRIRYVAAYKRQSETGKNKWVVSSYFETEWLKEDAETANLPIVLNLSLLYERLLKSLIPLQPRAGECLDTLVKRLEQLRKLEREIDKLEIKLKKEKQFNRKVEINRLLKELTATIEELER